MKNVVEQMKVGQMREALINRELETTPWDALVNLVYKQISLEFSEMSYDELNGQSLRYLGESVLNHKVTIAKLAESYLKGASTLEITQKAKDALKLEYERIASEDIRTLYQIFVTKEGVAPNSLVQASLNTF